MLCILISGQLPVRQVIDKAMGIHEQALRLRAYRSNIIASNIANTDTPGYKAQDIDFNRILTRQAKSDVAAGIGSVRVHKTDARHFGINRPLQADPQYRNPLQASLDGNTVDAHAEHTRFAQNTVQYQASLQFLSGRFKSLITAIKGE